MRRWAQQPAPHGRAWARALLVCLALALGGARAGAEAPSVAAQVSVDWSRVADADVQRCGLSRLRAGTLERLVDAGHAVVDDTDDGGVAVAVASVPVGLAVEVASGDVARAETLPITEPCDATFVLDVISRIAELVGEVARARPTAVAVEPERAPLGDDEGLFGSLNASLRASDAGGLLFGGGLGVRLRLAAGLELGVRGELTGTGEQGVTLVEAFVGASAAWQPVRRGLGLHLELGPALHLASSDRRSVTELDGMLGVGPQLSLGYLHVQLLGQLRLRRFEHRVDGQNAFDTGHLGLVLRIGGQLPGS